MPPKPVAKWDTVMVCDHFGPQVMQGNGRREMPESVMSEKNSCVLNVWTTDTKASKPVMLWIHGGGFDSGSAAGNPGMGLAKQDVVVVSLNHRLNILGFLDLSTFGERYRHSGMVGMLDIVQALEWIRDNIKAFGGDPSNVTIFGESGGGGKVGTLMCMPAARGLFHKAIIMSGTILNVNTKAMTEELGRAVVAELGRSRGGRPAGDGRQHRHPDAGYADDVGLRPCAGRGSAAPTALPARFRGHFLRHPARDRHHFQ